MAVLHGIDRTCPKKQQHANNNLNYFARSSHIFLFRFGIDRRYASQGDYNFHAHTWNNYLNFITFCHALPAQAIPFSNGENIFFSL
jgi:hypothetical protein